MLASRITTGHGAAASFSPAVVASARSLTSSLHLYSNQSRYLSLACRGSPPLRRPSPSKRIGKSRHKSIWSTRGSWHKPGCRWVRSEGDPKATPRDKDCPACQEEDLRPFELSPRDLLWQERRRRLCHEMEKDPYEFMFGASNQRVKEFWAKFQRPPQLWSMKQEERVPGSGFSHEGDTPESFYGSKASKTQDSPSKTHKTSEDGTPRTYSREAYLETRSKAAFVHELASSSAGAAERGGSEAVSQSSPKPNISGSICWSRSVTTPSGQRFDSSGELEYDPISNRMVPKTKAPSKEAILEREETLNKRSGAKSTPRKAVHPKSSNGQGEKIDVHKTSGVEFTDKVKAEEVKYMKIKKDMEEVKAQEDSAKVEEARSKIESQPPQPRVSSDQSEASSEEPRSAKEAYQNFKNRNIPPSVSSSYVPANTVETEPQIESTKVSNGHEAVASQRAWEEQAEQAFKFNDPPPANILRKLDWLRAKHELEQAAVKDRKCEGSSHQPQPLSAISREKLEAAEAWKRYRDSPIGTASSKYDGKETKPSSTSDTSIGSPMRKDQPLPVKPRYVKSMNAREFNDHTSALCESWKKQAEPKKQKAAGPAEERLAGEVDAQKRAMLGFENKWSQNACASNLRNAPHAPQTPGQAEIIPGEGDMHPKVAEYAASNRWYKDSAPGTEEQKARDRELVQALRQIYEKAYGHISPTHRQGSLRKDADKTVETNAMFEALRDADDAHFNRWVNQNRIASTLPRKTEVASGADLPPSAGIAQPNTTATGDKLQEQQSNSRVNPIDGTSPSPTPQAANYASPTGFVNHDIPPASSQTTHHQPKHHTTPRRVRKEEAVFSGTLPNQKYSIPEIVDIMNRNNINNFPSPSPATSANGSGNNDPNRTNDNPPPKKDRSRHATAFQKGAQHQRRRFLRRLARILLFGTWTALCCYAVGYLTEYLREQRRRVHWAPRDARHGAEPTGWETVRWTEKKSGGGGGGFWSDRREKRGMADERREVRSGGVGDMPLRGFEFPLVGLLVWSVWFLISNAR